MNPCFCPLPRLVVCFPAAFGTKAGAVATFWSLLGEGAPYTNLRARNRDILASAVGCSAASTASVCTSSTAAQASGGSPTSTSRATSSGPSSSSPSNSAVASVTAISGFSSYADCSSSFGNVSSSVKTSHMHAVCQPFSRWRFAVHL